MNGFDIDALLDSLADKVAARLRNGLGESNGSNGTAIKPRLLTVAQAAVYLGRSKTSLQHLISEGSVPTVRHDKRVFLDRVDLDQWIDEGKSG